MVKEASAEQEGVLPKVDLKLFKSLQEQRLKLAKRKERLNDEEYRLKLLKEQIESKIEELKKIRSEISKHKKSMAMHRQKPVQSKEKKSRGKVADKSEDKMGQLARIYEATPPEQAGPLLERLDAKIAAMILMRMNERRAGKILGFIEPTKAAKISEEMVK